jgi:hypothetical protein
VGTDLIVAAPCIAAFFAPRRRYHQRRCELCFWHWHTRTHSDANLDHGVESSIWIERSLSLNGSRGHKLGRRGRSAALIGCAADRATAAARFGAQRLAAAAAPICPLVVLVVFGTLPADPSLVGILVVGIDIGGPDLFVVVLVRLRIAGAAQLARSRLAAAIVVVVALHRRLHRRQCAPQKVGLVRAHGGHLVVFFLVGVIVRR